MYSVNTYQFLASERQCELRRLAEAMHLVRAFETGHKQRPFALRTLGHWLKTSLAGRSLGSGACRGREPRSLTDGVDAWLSIGIPRDTASLS